MDYISVREASTKWDISERQVQKLCVEKRIEGQSRMGHMWLIPKNALKPTDPRKAASEEANNMAQQDVKKVRTSTLLHRLFKATNLEGFIEKNADIIQTPSFHAYISELCHVMDQVPERFIKQSSIERTYGHQLFNGTRKPSRDKVIQLAFGFGLDVDGTQKLLKMAQKNTLYPRIKRDTAILYCINHHMGIVEAQSILHDLGLTLLGDD